MNFKVDVLFQGFPGSMACGGYLGLGTCALITTTDDKHILLDTMGENARNFMKADLAKHGLTLDDIDVVLLTHSHFDHAANVDLFPKAKFYMHHAEWDYMYSLPRDLTVDETAASALRFVDVTLLEGEEGEIMPGISFIRTPGHTPGSTSYILDQGEEGKWVLSGDAAKNRGELRTLEVMMTKNPEESSASLRKIKAAGNRILPGHDGWIRIEGDKVIPEGGNDFVIRFTQGLTVNGGLTEIVLKLD